MLAPVGFPRMMLPKAPGPGPVPPTISVRDPPPSIVTGIWIGGRFAASVTLAIEKRIVWGPGAWAFTLWIAAWREQPPFVVAQAPVPPVRSVADPSSFTVNVAARAPGAVTVRKAATRKETAMRSETRRCGTYIRKLPFRPFRAEARVGPAEASRTSAIAVRAHSDRPERLSPRRPTQLR